PDYLLSLDLAKVMLRPDAEKGLEEAEQKLRALHTAGNLTRESQHSLLVNLVTAHALAGSIRGATPDDIASGLQVFAKALNDAGGLGAEESPFGPKVTAVFKRLLR